MKTQVWSSEPMCQRLSMDMVVCICNPSTGAGETSISLGVDDQPVEPQNNK